MEHFAAPLDAEPDGEDGAGSVAAAAAPIVAHAPVIGPVDCPVEGYGNLKVYFDGCTHASGNQRAFIQCQQIHAIPGVCRKHVCVKDFENAKHAASHLQAWAMLDGPFADSKEHIAAPPDEVRVVEIFSLMMQ